uniref:Uncharacterized protein n=1 Tax=Xanthomonas campestris pv. glycines TaxID=473421 RepID=Q6JCV8_XANCG|nr:hypothetical protein [Xanthomonas citri pv. glycines]
MVGRPALQLVSRTFDCNAIVQQRRYRCVARTRLRFQGAQHDRFGDNVRPREWFLVPLPVIDEAVKRIQDGSLNPSCKIPSLFLILNSFKSGDSLVAIILTSSSKLLAATVISPYFTNHWSAAGICAASARKYRPHVRAI